MSTLFAAARRLFPIAALLLGSSAAHALTQPDGATIPSAPGCNGGKTTGLAAQFACTCVEPNICNQGASCPGGSPSCDPGTNGTCETTTWHNVNDNPCIPSNQSGIDPQADAKTDPETFHPTCPQTFTILTRGTAMFKNGFGWYNATGQKPADSDLHLMIACNDGPGTAPVLDLKSEPDYLGGDVGFFLVTPESHVQGGTCANGDCCATIARASAGEGYVYYSERKYNPDFNGASSWIHLLIYESQIFPSKYYFAWEDSNKSPNNDFTDLLTSVTGIQCSGAGVACNTGEKGVCGKGITECKNGALDCNPLFAAGAEECNGQDDDCDGVADDGAVCPNPDDVCSHGACVPHCNNSEFPCPDDITCDVATGLCLDPTCVGVDCAAGQVCHGGECVAPCDGVVCPHGQTCVADACVDLCKGVSCSAGQVCKDGKCFAGCASCDGLSCEGDTKCVVASGTCEDPSCASGCPDGTYCSGGQCKGPCDGVVCPTGQSCTNGECVYGNGVGGSGGLGAGGFDMGGSGGSGAGNGAAGSGGDTLDPMSGKACSCRTPGGEPGDTDGALALAVAGLAAAAIARRRPQRPRA